MSLHVGSLNKTLMLDVNGNQVFLGFEAHFFSLTFSFVLSLRIEVI